MESLRKIYIIGLILITFAGLLKGQTSGCTDPRANNYNPLATENDGSCTYNITIYNPPFKYILPDEIDETSGLIYYKGSYWTLNDSGGLPVLYRLDTATGQVIQRVRLRNTQNIDWESLAQDDDYIYVGDFGNNSGNRDDLCIYKVAKSQIPDSGDIEVNWEKINFVYEDYKGPVSKRRENNFDCEAMITAGDSIYLFSKDWQDQHTRLYRLSKTGNNQIAKVVTRFNSAGLITGADINHSSGEVTLVGYTNNSWVPFLWILFDYKGTDFFSGNKRRIDMLNVSATQTEGISYVSGKNGVISSEGRKLFSQTMYTFSTAPWTDKAYAGQSGHYAEPVGFNLYPNPLKKSKLHINFTSPTAAGFQLAVFDSSGKQVYAKSYSLTRKNRKAELNLKLKKLKKGVYVVRITSGDLVTEKKFIKE